MDYKKIYFSLIKKRIEHPANLEFSYTEKHHIVPRSIDKSLEKEKSNIVVLSARQHFIAHALLVKIYKQSGEKEKWYKMLCAFKAMSNLFGSVQHPELRYKNQSDSKLYEIWKQQLIKYIKDNHLKSGENSNHLGTKMYYNMELKQVKYFKDNEKFQMDLLKDGHHGLNTVVQKIKYGYLIPKLINKYMLINLIQIHF